MYYEKLTKEQQKKLCNLLSKACFDGKKVKIFENESENLEMHVENAKYAVFDYDIMPSKISSDHFESFLKVSVAYNSFMAQTFGPRYMKDTYEYIDKRKDCLMEEFFSPFRDTEHYSNDNIFNALGRDEIFKSKLDAEYEQLLKDRVSSKEKAL